MMVRDLQYPQAEFAQQLNARQVFADDFSSTLHLQENSSLSLLESLSYLPYLLRVLFEIQCLPATN